MLKIHTTTLQRILTLLVCMLICKIVVGVLLNYRDYMPPNFESDFLQGRAHYFFGGYQWAFDTHITSGPCSLILGMILISEQFCRRFPTWHRYLGRIQVACVLLLVAPAACGWHFALRPVPSRAQGLRHWPPRPGCVLRSAGDQP